MANKFTSLIFTEEGKDIMTKALADKGQMSITNAYTFTVSLTKDLTYSQISGLNPKQTKPMGTVTTDLTTNTVESRLIIDNRDVTADYNLKGITITGVYGTDNYVLGIINTNETTLVPAYNGQSAQTINLDVSFAISDTSIVTVNTQYAGMLTVADYIALQKYIDQRDAKKADDTAAVHKTGNETINDIKTFLKIIVGSVSGNSGTSDRVNTLAINADVALSSLSNGVYLSTNASKTTSDKPTGAAETYVFVKESNVERFTDISNGQSYFRVKNGSTYTAWNRFSTAAELSNVDASAVHKTGNETIGGSKTFSSAIIANLQGNADTATKLKTARTISFSGAATGTGTFDGSGNVDIALTESATTRTNTSSAQSLAVGGTVTIIDSITTNTSGEITGVNVKTATMPSVYPPNNDSNLVHKSGAETIGGSKTFTDGLSGALAGNATSATKLANARKINGENFDGTADINVDPVVQVISTNKDVFTLDNGFYYYSNVSATNKPSGSSNYFVVEVIQSGNNGFMKLVDSNNNAWWTTKTGGAWSSWKALANDALVAHLDTAETFTGKKTFSAGLAGELTGNAATATKWAAPRTVALTGDVSGSVNIDGSGDVSMATSGTNLVHKTGDETIAGDKTFTGEVDANNLAVSGQFQLGDSDYFGRLGMNASTHLLQVNLAGAYEQDIGAYAVTNLDSLNIDTMVGVLNNAKASINKMDTTISINISDGTKLTGTLPLTDKTKLNGSKIENLQGAGQRVTQRWTITSIGTTFERYYTGSWSNWQDTTRAPVNLLYNTNFKNNADGWVNRSDSAPANMQVITSGNQNYLKVTVVTAWQGKEQYVPVDYTGSTGTVNVATDVYGFTNATLPVYVYAADSNKTAIGSAVAVGNASYASWTHISKDVTIPQNAKYIVFSIQSAVNNGVIGIMNPQITAGVGEKQFVSGSEMQDISSGNTNAAFNNLNVSGTITGITKSGKLVASGYRPAMNYVYNDFMVQVTLAGGNLQVPVNTAFTLPNEIPAPAMNMTLNLGDGILINVQTDRKIFTQGGDLPGNFWTMLTWVPA